MSYNKTNWINDQTELNAENMNHIENGIEQAYGQFLLAVDSVAPEECTTGDKYYNTETNKIYTATGTNTWGTTGVDAELGVFYIVLESQNIYTYNGTTLVSVGGGSGGGGDSTPIGTVEAYAGSTVPDGYLFCDGSAVSRETYKDLYRIIGTTYGAGDGSTTFNLPDINGKVVVMLDSNDTAFDTLGETGGEKAHTLTIDEMPSHSHGIQVAGTPLNTSGTTLGFVSGTNAGSGDFWNMSLQRTNGGTHTGNIIEAGNGQTHNNLQPYIVLNYIIKVQKLAGTVLSEQLPIGTEVDFDGTSADIPIGWEEVTDPESYSTSEVKTNQTWIDGKPIYRKVINSGSLSLSTTTTNVNTNTPNIDKVIDINFMYRFTDNTWFKMWNLNELMCRPNGIVAISTYQSATFPETYITLEYTKTTD